MTSIRIHTEGFSATQACGRALAPLLEPGAVIVLTGDLGAGKTQLTKGLAEGLGVPDGVTSPTFNILLVHEGRMPLFHFDLYRLDDERELDDIDYWGTLESDGVSVVEWGDKFPSALPDERLGLRLHITGDDERSIEMEPSGERAAQVAQAWADACDGLPGVRVECGPRRDGATAVDAPSQRERT